MSEETKDTQALDVDNSANLDQQAESKKDENISSRENLFSEDNETTSTSVGEDQRIDNSTTDVNFLDTIPEEYKDKPYLKDVDSMDKLLKKLDGAESLIGKKNLAPESPDDYSFKDLEDGLTRNEDLTSSAKKVMHSLGLSQDQAVGLQEWFDSYIAEAAKAQESMNQEKIQEEYGRVLEEKFGNKKSDVEAIAGRMLKPYLSDESQEIVKTKMDNDSLMVLMEFANNLYDKHFKEGSLPLSKGQPVGDLTEDQKRQKRFEIYKSEEFNNPSHPMHKQKLKEAEKYGAKLWTMWNK